MKDTVVSVLSEIVPDGVRQGEMDRGGRVVRWVEAGVGTPVVLLDAGLAEPGSLAWAAVMRVIASKTRSIGYDRAGVGLSDAMTPLTLDGELEDQAALVERIGDAGCIIVGHSWGGLLAQLTAISHPEVVRGLVLVDPAHEENYAGVPLRFKLVDSVTGVALLAMRRCGLLPRIVRSNFKAYAERLTEDPALRARFLELYVSSYGTRAEVAMFATENRLGKNAIPSIREMRAAGSMPEVPIVVLSATTGLPRPMRDRWTELQADLVRSHPPGAHVVVESGHAIHQEKPAYVAGVISRMIDDVRSASGG